MSFTYATLKQAIQDWTENDADEFTEKLDEIIGLAELRIYRECDLTVLRRHATSTLNVGDRYVSKPSDMVLDRFLAIGSGDTYTVLLRKDISWLLDYGFTSGTPRWFSDWDADYFVICPTPSTASAVTLGYTYRPTGLSSSNTTTWLSENADDLLLAACMLEAIAFEKSEIQDVQLWMNKYELAKASLLREEVQRQRVTEDRVGEQR